MKEEQASSPVSSSSSCHFFFFVPKGNKKIREVGWFYRNWQVECPGTPTPQRGNKKQTSAHSARVCSFPLRPSTSHIKQQRTRALHFEINTQGKLWSSLLNDTKQHSLVSVHCFHCELSRTSLSWITLRCHRFLPGKVGAWIRLRCGRNFRHFYSAQRWKKPWDCSDLSRCWKITVIECAEVHAPLSPGGSCDLENTSKPDWIFCRN